MTTQAPGRQGSHGATAPGPALPPSFQQVLLLLGQLNYAWTNTETLLIHFIAGLAGIDKETAIVIFLTLNTSRARLDLVERLAKMGRTERETMQDILAVTGEMARILKHRNRFNHCLYSFDGETRQARTILMRITETKDAIRYGKQQPLDDAEIEGIRESIRRVEAVNRQAWRVILANRFPV